MDEQFYLKNRVKELRSRLRLRQSDLAREVDVSRQTILAIEKGRLNPSIAVSLRISRVLREPVDYIFYLERGQGEALWEPVEEDTLDRSTREPVLGRAEPFLERAAFAEMR